MTPITTYLTTDTLLGDEKKAKRVRWKLSFYIMNNDELFQVRILRPLLKMFA